MRDQDGTIRETRTIDNTRNVDETIRATKARPYARQRLDDTRDWKEFASKNETTTAQTRRYATTKTMQYAMKGIRYYATK